MITYGSIAMPEIGVDIRQRFTSGSINNLNINSQSDSLLVFSNVAADEFAVDIYYGRISNGNADLETDRPYSKGLR
jgi:hypothetical protein